MTVADGTEGFRSSIQLVGFKSEIEDTVFVAVFREKDRVFHVSMVNGALLAEEMDDFDGIAALPEKMAQVIVGANFFADGLAKLDERARVVDNKVGMHLESQALDAVFAGVFRGFLPVRDDFFLPLPILHLGVFGRPAIGDPVGLSVLRSASGAAGKTDDDFDVEHFCKEDGFAESVDVFLRVIGVGMDRIAVTTKGGDVNAAVFKLFLPGLGFGAVGDEVVKRTVNIVGIAARTDLD